MTPFWNLNNVFTTQTVTVQSVGLPFQLYLFQKALLFCCTVFFQIGTSKKVINFFPVFRIRIRIHMFMGLPDPDPLVRGMDPAPDPDPSIIMQK